MEEKIPITPELPSFPTGKRELLFCVCTALIGLLLANFVIFGGFRLGFAIASSLSILLVTGYLTAAGYKGDGYTRSILVLCLVIAAGFGYSSDSFVKFVLFLFLLVGVNLSLCLMAGQNRRDPGGLRSLLDAPRALFSFGFGMISPALRGLAQFFSRGGEASRRTGAILAGLAIAVPALAVMIPLLMSSDAAFEGLMDLLPDFEISELFVTLFWGCLVFLVLYSRGTGLSHSEKHHIPEKRGAGLHLFTVNTLLAAVCLLYGVYLFSQLAYLSGGFLGILPEGYSIAEYARRGFFEMAVLSCINLVLITFSISMASRKAPAALSTRLMCLFLGIMTLFLVCASCAKILLYIGSYGLTRLRVLTMAIILFLGLTAGLVSLWLFLPQLQYMKAVVLIALTIGAGVLWMDVDTVVARYNVEGYLSGQLETIDTIHLSYLGDGAVQYVALLTEAEDPAVAETARDLVEYWYVEKSDDFRSWTYVNHIAQNYTGFWKEASPGEEAAE